MELYTIRHGETDANAQKILQGWLDTDINENGRQQAQSAADNFNEAIDAIYSSDLNRAKQTAEYFRKKLPGVPYFEDKRLRERGFGEATGQPHGEIDWDKFWSVPNNEPPVHGAETLDEYNKRVQEFITTLRESGFMSVLIVTHSGTINRMRELINGDEHEHQANASVQRLVLP